MARGVRRRDLKRLRVSSSKLRTAKKRPAKESSHKKAPKNVAWKTAVINHIGNDVPGRSPGDQKVSPRFRAQNESLIDWSTLLEVNKDCSPRSKDPGVDIEDGKISVCHRKLGAEAEKKIRQVLGENKKFIELKLRNCELSNKFLNSILAKNFKVNIEALNLSANEGLDMSIVKKLVESFKTTRLNLSNINLTNAQVQSLALIKGITELKLIANSFESNSIAETIAALVNEGLETLVLDDTKISEKVLYIIARNMKMNSPGNTTEVKLRALDLSHITLEKMGVTAVSMIIKNAGGLEWLNLHHCELEENLLEKLCQGEKTNVKSLTLSSNPRIKGFIEVVARIADELGCEELNISTNSLYGKDIAGLACAKAPRKIRAIRMCENPIDDWAAVACLVKKWRIKDVDVSECSMCLDDIQKLVASLHDYKLDRLNVHHRRRCSDLQSQMSNMLKTIANIVIC